MSNAKDYIFGSMLKQTRERLGLTQSQAIELTGVTNMAHLESCSRLPSYESLLAICVGLKVSPESLMFGPTNREIDLQNRAMAFNRIKDIVNKIDISIDGVLR